MKAVKLALLTCQRKNYSFPNRQYNSLVSSCEDLGGVGTKSKYLMELTKEIWKYLLHHGITITAEYLPGSMNMEAYWYFKPSTSISENLSDETKTRDGSFCFSTVSLTSTVQCMKIGSIHWGNGCNAANLVQSVPLCFPTFFSDKQGFKKDSPGTTEKSVDFSSHMAVSGMVPSPSENVNRETICFATPSTSSIKSPGSYATVNNKKNIKISGLLSDKSYLQQEF